MTNAGFLRSVCQLPRYLIFYLLTQVSCLSDCHSADCVRFFQRLNFFLNQADTEVIATENATTVTEAIGALIEDAGVIAVTVPAAETGEEPDATDLPDQAATVNIAVSML
jgi:hypothetical protein